MNNDNNINEYNNPHARVQVYCAEPGRARQALLQTNRRFQSESESESKESESESESEESDGIGIIGIGIGIGIGTKSQSRAAVVVGGWKRASLKKVRVVPECR